MTLRFPEGRTYEDTVIALSEIKRAETVCIVEDAYYFYNQREGSISHQPKKEHIYHLMCNALEIKSIFPENKYKKIINIYICTVLLFALELGYQIDSYDEKLISFLNKELKKNIMNVSIFEILRCRRRNALLMAKIDKYNILLKYRFNR